MSDIRVKLIPQNQIKVRLGTQNKIKAIPVLGRPLLNFNDLLDFDDTQKLDKYVIVYNASTNKYKLVNPDLILSSAVDEVTSPGLPDIFINELDNKIDVDAGEF